MSVRGFLQLLASFAFFFAHSCFAATITFTTAESPLKVIPHHPDYFKGYYLNQGWWHSSGNSSGGDYYSTGNFPNSEYRSFFTFDLGSLNQRVISATLRVHRGGGDERNGVELGFWDVTSPAEEVNAREGVRTDIFEDLGSGRVYGSYSIDPLSVPDPYFNDMDLLSVKLNHNAIFDINSTARFFTIGASVLNDPEDRASIFGGYGGLITYLDVVVVPVSEPSPVFLFGLGLVGLWMTRRLKRPEHNLN